MPELPEVETIRRDLNELVVGKKLRAVTIHKPKMVHGSTAPQLIDALVGHIFTDVQRRGKLLIFSLNSKKYLLLHLKMTGQLIYRDKTHLIAGGHTLTKPEDNFDLPNKYTHVIFDFDDDSQLYFNDLRQFGYVQLASEDDKVRAVNKMGIEPLQPDYTLEAFAAALRRHPIMSVKPALLDQRFITGIGNIYADESCFAAGVLPARLVAELSDTEIVKLYKATQSIIAAAIKHRGTTFNDYRDSHGRKGNYVLYLMVYGRGGETCKKCKLGIIKKIKLSGRGTAFCPICQK